MRYAPSERFWRNFLLTCVFTGFTLGFSVASWNGLSPRTAPPDQEIGQQVSAGASGVADLATGPRAERARADGGAPQELDVSEGLAAPGSFAAVTGGSSETAGASARDFAGGIRDLSRRGSSASSSSSSSGGGRAAGGGFGSGGFGGSYKKDQIAQNTLKTSSPSVNRKPNTKAGGKGKKGGSGSKGKTDKTDTPAPSQEPAAEGPLGEAPPSQYGSAPQSPAATPEPLSMLLVGTGLVGLYRARKYLS